MISSLRLKSAAWIATTLAGAFLLFGLAVPGWSGGEDSKAPRPAVRVKIEDEKPVVALVDQDQGPVDPVPRIMYQPAANMNVNIRTETGANLHLSHFPMIQIDGKVMRPGIGGRFDFSNVPLPKVPGRRERRGHTTVWSLNDLRFTMTVEVVPTKSAGPAAKRQLDAVLVRYLVENKGNQARKVGLRIYIDTYIIDNDGAMFAAPTAPNKILDGVEFKGKEVPPYVQVLQRPNLKDPGYVAHLTLDLHEKPNRLVLTRHGFGFNSWDMPVNPSMGDSALGVFWDPKEIPAGGKRDLAYAYGRGIALKAGGDGHFNLVLSGSFEPGKQFTIAAVLADPSPGQSLSLDLPPGMERLEGKEIQPVPYLTGQEGQSLVLWKARALKLGRFPLRVRSSGGVTQTKIVTISKIVP